jgi:Zn-dependent protease with chaperone function
MAVSLDRANRSFLTMTLMALLLSGYLICAALGGAPSPLTASRASHVGVGGVLTSAGSLLPLLAFLTVATGSIAAGIYSLFRQVRASHRVGSRVRELTLADPGRLGRAASDVGLYGRVVLLDASEPFCFAFGALAPRVAVSRGLVEGVSQAELRAVLHHERYHVVNRDPLKASLAQTLSATFFFLPALGSLRMQYLGARELSADRYAARICGRPPLAGALLKVVRGPEWDDLEGVAAIGDPELLDVRVAQLETGTEPKLAGVGTPRAALSLAGAILLATSFLASASRFGEAITATDLLNGLLCAAILGTVGIAAYLAHASHACRRLAVGERE